MKKKKKIEVDTGFVDRLNMLVAKIGSVNALANKSGVPQSTLRNYFKGGEPGRPHLVALANAADVSVGWLAIGNGDLAKNGERDSSVTKFDYTPVNLYDVHGSAGHGAYVDNEEVNDVVAFRKTWLRNELNCDPSNLSMIFVTGDSMEPTLYSGDVVLVDHSVVNQITDAIWVIGVGDGPIIKRVQRLSRTEIRISSDNKKYDPMDVNLEKMPDGMRFIGRVVWSGRRM